MSVLDDSIKQSIHPLLPPTLKYGPILWIYIVREVRTALQVGESEALPDIGRECEDLHNTIFTNLS